MFTKIAVTAALALVAVVPANAVTVLTLYNTGVDATGAATIGNGADLHWMLADGPAYNGATNGTFPIGPWISEDATSRWITPTPDAGTLTDAVDNTYSFTETFSLTGYSAATASFTGRYAGDNAIDSITLNGVALVSSPGGYSSWTSFDSTGGNFNAGDNTLTFVVRNFGNGGGVNPAGLLVQVVGTADLTSAVPEASVWSLMIAGFGMVGLGMRRRTAMLAA